MSAARFYSVWRCDTLCTSGFVDDVMFAHNDTRNRRRNSDSLGSSMNLTPRHILKLTHQMSWTLISTIALFHSVSIDEVAPFHNVCCVSVAIKEEYLRPFVTPPSI